MSFAADLAKEVEKTVVGAYLDFRGGPVAKTFLNVAHTLASFDTGAMKANITAFSGEPPAAFDTPEQARRSRSGAAGTPAPADLISQALTLSRAAGLKKRYGFASAAGYSSYQAEGTETITARPFWQAAERAAATVRVKP